ncbi:TIGR03503 family protein [Agarivorans sp. Toyoura001]|uniref:TIGR03503 family protein n=1 Tax=Agarivorans sp. Toyoura001 TaxID=2283141 RepID=UPI0010EB4EE8|nr:TIGR03503 family protein [Agarivorans sp. Toyoura001]GDY27817.1 TIGR03503 family protein [Agarivorans sp. Toyoura001]
MIKNTLWLLLWLALPLQASTIFENRDIPLIDNRFRLDHSIEKATFLLYRSPGSPAAILVRPDGSKIYAWEVPKNVSWLETDELDIVTIENPMRGPWQAVAENNGRNRIRILSDVELNVDPIPHQLYQGERLRISARLSSKGERIDLEVMLKEALMNVALMRQQLLEDQTVEVRRDELGKFYDDGKDYDEYADDGVFTTHIKLEARPGKYEMVVSTLNQIFTRAQLSPVLIYPNPVSIKVMSPKDEQRQARMALVIDTDEVRPESVVISGKVYNNVGWEQAFQTYADGEEFTVDLPTPTEQGRYRVMGTLLATTIQNREIVIDLPEEDFVILPPPPPPPEPVVVKTVVVPEPEMSLWLVILVSVFGFVAVAGLAFLFIWWRKRKAFEAALKNAKEAPAAQPSVEPKMDEASTLKMPSE